MPIVGDPDSPDAAGDHQNTLGDPPNNSRERLEQIVGEPEQHTRTPGTQQEHIELVPLMCSIFWTLFDDIYTSFTDSGHAATTHAPHTTFLPRMAPSHHSRSCRETRAPAFPREHARVERTPTDAPG